MHRRGTLEGQMRGEVDPDAATMMVWTAVTGCGEAAEKGENVRRRTASTRQAARRYTGEDQLPYPRRRTPLPGKASPSLSTTRMNGRAAPASTRFPRTGRESEDPAEGRRGHEEYPDGAPDPPQRRGDGEGELCPPVAHESGQEDEHERPEEIGREGDVEHGDDGDLHQEKEQCRRRVETSLSGERQAAQRVVQRRVEEQRQADLQGEELQG